MKSGECYFCSGVPSGHDKQKSRDDEFYCFFHLLQVELSSLSFRSVAVLHFNFTLSSLLHGLQCCCSRCCTELKNKTSQVACSLAWDVMGCRRGDSTHPVRRCSPVSFLCLKWLFSVHSVLCICADVRRRCCTGCCTSKCCTAVCSAFGKEHDPCRTILCVIIGSSARKCYVHVRSVQSAFHWSPVSRLPLRLHAWEEVFWAFCMISVLRCQNISQTFATPQNRCNFNLYPPAFRIYPHLLLLHETGAISGDASSEAETSMPHGRNTMGTPSP